MAVIVAPILDHLNAELPVTVVGKVRINAVCLLCAAYTAQSDVSYYATYTLSAVETAVFLDFAQMLEIRGDGP